MERRREGVQEEHWHRVNGGVQMERKEREEEFFKKGEEEHFRVFLSIMVIKLYRTVSRSQ